MTVAIVAIVLVVILAGIFLSARGPRNSDMEIPVWFVILWLVQAVIYLSILAAIGYVAWHFISKFW